MEKDLVEALFSRYREPVYRFLTRMLGDAAAAEDLTQDVFLRAMGAAYQPKDQERAWVFQIARNLGLDHLRKAVHRGPTLEVVEEPARFTDRLVAMDVSAALRRLPDSDREMFLLREVGGLDYAEIALVCSVTPDAVRNRLHRARLALRQALSSGVVPFSRVRP
jgi:RNA polymerase sigma-70 factor (ECF subfamily)